MIGREGLRRVLELRPRLGAAVRARGRVDGGGTGSPLQAARAPTTATAAAIMRNQRADQYVLMSTTLWQIPLPGVSGRRMSATAFARRRALLPPAAGGGPWSGPG